MRKIISLSGTIIISATLLIALAVPSIILSAVVLPIGIAHARAQINTPPGTGICTGTCTGQLASLTDRWWQLILSIETPPQLNPFSSTTVYNGNCGQLMQANTLFLVGQISPGAMNHGTCNISPQTSVLLPLVNSFWIDCQSFNQNPTHAGACGLPNGAPNGVKQQIAAVGQPFGISRSLASVDGATNYGATLDNVPLQPVRVQSPPGGFETTFATNNVFGIPLGPTAPWHGVADGFWVLLPSLPIGTHTLAFGGCLPSIGCQTNTYTIVVR